MADASSDRSQGHLLSSLQDLNLGEGVLPESKLRELSKDFGVLIPTNGTPIEETQQAHLLSLYPVFLQTADSPSLSPAYGAAAMNALCGYLVRGSNSSLRSFSELCFGFEVWKALFGIFLMRSESNKSKPMQQVLKTLMILWIRNPDEKVKAQEVTMAVQKAFSLIAGDNDCTSGKPALQFLEHLLTKEGPTALNILSTVDMIPNAQLAEKSAITCSDMHDTVLSEAADSSWGPRLRSFISSVLHWVQYPDTVAAAGRLLCAFVKSFLCEDTTSSDSVLPLCMDQIKQLLDEQSVSLESLKNHVLPELFRIQPKYTLNFLDSKPLLNLAQGDVSNFSGSDLEICLLSVQVAEESGILRSLVTAAENKETCCNISSTALALGLLEHSSPRVRIQAFLLLIRSDTAKNPYADTVLLRLRESLPLFHCEVDPNSRNTFIGIVETLIVRVCNTAYPVPGEVEPSQAVQHRVVENETQPRQPSNDVHGRHLSFLRWYTVFLAKELQPTASYQRHITALGVLNHLQQYDPESNLTSIWYSSVMDGRIENTAEPPSTLLLVRPLLDLLMDAFDDVRASAASCLFAIMISKPTSLHEAKKSVTDSGRPVFSASPNVHGERTDLSISKSDFQRGYFRFQIQMRASGRADHADGFARCFEMLWRLLRLNSKRTGEHTCAATLLADLEGWIHRAQSDIHTASRSSPLHGNLIALRYIFEYERSHKLNEKDSGVTAVEREETRSCLKTDLLRNSEDVWNAVKETLCQDSPEGDDDEAEASENLDIGLKDTLSYCWRALKESSLLIHSMFECEKYDVQGLFPKLGEQDIQVLGNLTYTQLAELRHRGAFSTVARTFSTCCITCANHGSEEIRQLPQIWYQSALQRISQNATSLCRRSAGLPSIITGILAAYPKGHFFDSVILDLQAIARKGVPNNSRAEKLLLPQVHALNCLTAIFWDSRFGSSSDAHAADTLDIAGSCLENKLWAICNSGLMLLNSLVRRLNGGTDTSCAKAASFRRKRSPAVYEKYPSLPKLIVQLLSSSSQGRGPKASTAPDGHLTANLTGKEVFLAFEIIERFGVPMEKTHGPEIDAFIGYYLEGPNGAIREKAAKAYANVVPQRSVAAAAEGLVDEMASMDDLTSSQNRLHGRLLRVRYLVARIAPTIPTLLSAGNKILRTKLTGLGDTLDLGKTCPFTVSVYLDILMDVLETLQKHEDPRLILFSTQLSLKVLDLMPSISRGSSAVGKHPLSDAARQRVHECVSLSIEQQESRGQPGRAFLFEPYPWNSPHQGHDDGGHAAILWHAKNLGKAFVRNHEAHGKVLASWVSWLQLIGGEDSVSISTQVYDDKLTDHEEHSARLTGAESLKSFLKVLDDEGWKKRKGLLQVYFVLYDRLIDDDEGIREIGAELVSKLVSGPSGNGSGSIKRRSLSPPAARQKLLQFFVKQYGNSRALRIEAIRRLLPASSSFKQGEQRIELGSGSPDERGTNLESQPPKSMHTSPVRELLDQAMIPNTLLFVEERQNLYIDDVQEARAWSQVLVDIPRWKNSGNFNTWTINGISALTREVDHKIEQRPGERTPIDGRSLAGQLVDDKDDGCLGWASKPQVFTLGMRVILAAGILLSRKKGEVNDKAKNHCKARLEKLLTVGLKNRLHELWIIEVQDILRSKAVTGAVLCVHSKVATFSCQPFFNTTTPQPIFGENSIHTTLIDWPLLPSSTPKSSTTRPKSNSYPTTLATMKAAFVVVMLLVIIIILVPIGAWFWLTFGRWIVIQYHFWLEEREQARRDAAAPAAAAAATAANAA